MTTGPASRTARAALFAAVCVSMAALGHSWASGVAVPLWSLGAAFSGTASVAWWLAGRERGALVVTGSTVVAQLGLHTLFGLTQSPGREPAGLMSHDMADLHGGSAATAWAMRIGGMHMHMPMNMSMDMAGSAGHRSTASDPMGMASGGHDSTAMFFAHLLAAVVCGLWLWRGEAAAFRLGRALTALVAAPLRRVWRVLFIPARTAPADDPLSVRRAADDAPAHALRGVLLHHVLSRRGPPQLAWHC
ncbi:hypothetical protein QMK19_09265 [Streptomyces sp. H10-C2]|uniref:hypothetical protein n=1 Tax=unclassified Streptomyces TaxID=2593676 RepID=UPI0024BB539D|nr:MULTISPECIES: hypothetical protein [unclassified Streptomyces]MDJ0340905.1 hypothetical protein [Streptomyces sp. PH10-H1]MDJ0369863.1 hypothetical protein [Streptomyces sp. H10-C2]